MEFNATFLVSIVSFLVFVFIMNKILYSPLSKIIDEREGVIDGNYADAKNYSDSAENITNELNNKMVETENSARSIIADKIKQSNEASKQLTMEAASQSACDIAECKSALEEEKRLAELNLKSEVGSLAEQIASKVLGFDVKGKVKIDG